MLNFISVIGLFIVLDYKVPAPFNGVSSILTAILSIFSSQTINIPLFLVFILFSLPRFPAPFSINEVSTENLRFFFFAFLSFCVNVITFLYGVKYDSSSQQSVSLMAISNNVALFFSVLADIESRSPPNSKFSFGFKRAKIVSGFSMSILLLFSSYSCISDSMVHLVDMNLNQKTNKDLFILTIISCVLDISGSFFLRSLDPRHCELLKRSELVPVISDFIFSFAAVISTFLSFFFNLNFLDPFVSLATSAMLFALSVPKFKRYFLILLEAKPANIDMPRILRNIQFEAKPDIKLLSIGEENGNVMTMNCQIARNIDKKRLMNKLTKRIGSSINDWTIEIFSV